MAMREALVATIGCLLAAASLAQPDCTLTLRYGSPANPGYLGLNSVLGLVVNLTYSDPAAIRAATALNIGALRHPGGTVANYWSLENGSYVGGDGTTKGCSNGTHWNYCSFPPLHHPPETFTAAQYLKGVGAAVPTTVYCLNVFTLSAADALRQLDYLRSTGAPVHRIEMGNEFYISRQYSWRFPTVDAYLDWITPVVAHARAVFPAAKVAVVAESHAKGGVSPWNAGLAKRRSLFDALSIHMYSPSNGSVAAITRNATLWPAIVAGYGDFSTAAIVNLIRRDFPDGVEVWRTEFNYDVGSSDQPLPDLYDGGVHGMFWASSVLGAIGRAGWKIPIPVVMLHAWLRGGWDMRVGIADVPSAHGSAGPILVNGVAQIFSHMSREALLRQDTTHPVDASASCPSLNLTVLGVNGAPCVSAAAFTNASAAGVGGGAASPGVTLALLNKCPDGVDISLDTSGWSPSRLLRAEEATIYSGLDPGGWAPLPADPRSLPWPGPLRPTHLTTADTLGAFVRFPDGALPAVSLPPISLSFVRLTAGPE